MSLPIANKLFKIRYSQLSDKEMVRVFLNENREYFCRSEPTREPSYYELNSIERRLQRQSNLISNGEGYFFHIFIGDELLAMVNLNNVVRGAFQACHLGYKISQNHSGKNLMYQILREILPFAFKDLKFHRIMANYESWNIASGKILRNLGFEEEGFAQKYLHLNGAWRDHVLTSLIRENFNVGPII